MQEKTIKKILFFGSILLTLILIIISLKSSPESITGKIKQINYYSSSMSIYVYEKEEQIVIFDKIFNLKENQTITVYGKYEQYQNKTQFLADKIILKKGSA